MGYGIDKKRVGDDPLAVRHQKEKEKITEIDKQIFPDKTLEEVNTQIALQNQDEDFMAPTDVEYDKEGNIIGLKKSKPINKRVTLKNMGWFVMSQSMIKSVINKYQEEKEFCPKFMNEVYICKNMDSLSSEPMLKGKFFESLALGSTTGSSPVTDLPRKKLSKKRIAELTAKKLPIKGDKTLDQIRIETQAERFKAKAIEYCTSIQPGVNCHVPIYKKFDQDILIAGEFDWWPTPFLYDGVMRLAVVDLKLTGDVNSSFSDFGWGNPSKLDHLQGDMYHWLARDIDFELNPHLKDILDPRLIDIIQSEQMLFLYWVWGYREPLEQQDKIIERTYRDDFGGDLRQRDLAERIRKAYNILKREEAMGWVENPCQQHCRMCPMNKSFGGDCKSSLITRV